MPLENLNWRKSSYTTSNGGNCVELAGIPRTHWRKSAHSGPNGGECVELASVRDTHWRKAHRSGENGGNCVELADVAGVVAVRDSKDPDGPVLLLTRAALRTAVQFATDTL
ncbi:DUF397 domain-containing protein [Actinomadura spongiicola]|uniref:DUF397 domain-containing protein n=1 Tax=Actinomadura spongiicola TaxID=2303421 RepID=A0A372GN58_9ACTN|nr:DUF397 domain-containing protein [Actinomadura spongiicola]RFS86775.1 DUF397 domain-containing protein [Actinomadura spongiicola]